jgi:hypothetical protein
MKFVFFLSVFIYIFQFFRVIFELFKCRSWRDEGENFSFSVEEGGNLPRAQLPSWLGGMCSINLIALFKTVQYTHLRLKKNVKNIFPSIEKDASTAVVRIREYIFIYSLWRHRAQSSIFTLTNPFITHFLDISPVWKKIKIKKKTWNFGGWGGL